MSKKSQLHLIMTLLRERLAPDQQGATAVEYALIAVWIGLARGDAKTGGPADQGLVNARPGPVFAEQVRAHEGLVIKTSAEERREQVVDRAYVELERWPAASLNRR